MADLRHNPTQRKDNCGYCAISLALYEKDGQLQTAEELYQRMREALHLRPEDDLPRTLIYGNSGTQATGLPIQHGVLNEGTRSPTDYFIHSVAIKLGLPVTVENASLQRLNAFLQQSAHTSPALRFRTLASRFLEDREEHPGRRIPTMAAMEKHYKDELVGRAIIGFPRGKSNHFLNLTIHPTGDATATDAQIGESYVGLELVNTLRNANLFMRWNKVA